MVKWRVFPCVRHSPRPSQIYFFSTFGTIIGRTKPVVCGAGVTKTLILNLKDLRFRFRNRNLHGIESQSGTHDDTTSTPIAKPTSA